MDRDDRIALALGRAVAARLDVEPVFVLARGLFNLSRLDQEQWGTEAPATWADLFARKDFPAIHRLLTADIGGEAHRLIPEVFDGVLEDDTEADVVGGSARGGAAAPVAIR